MATEVRVGQIYGDRTFTARLLKITRTPREGDKLIYGITSNNARAPYSWDLTPRTLHRFYRLLYDPSQ